MTSSAPFPPADHATWRALVAKALRVDDPDAALARLRSTTPDGLTIEPLYTAADTHGTTAALPGFGTRRRGRTPAATRVSGWEIRQRVALDDCPAGARGDSSAAPPASGSWCQSRHRSTSTCSTPLAEVLVDLVPVTSMPGRPAQTPARRCWRSGSDAASPPTTASGASVPTRSGAGPAIPTSTSTTSSATRSDLPSSSSRRPRGHRRSRSTARAITTPVPPTPTSWRSRSPRRSPRCVGSSRASGSLPRRTRSSCDWRSPPTSSARSPSCALLA